MLDFDITSSDYYLLCDAGLFYYTQYNAVVFEVHACILPEYRGKSINYAKDSLDWMFTNTNCLKVVAKIPAFNRRAIHYAKKAGLEMEGLIKKAYLKNSRLHDLVVMGASCR